MATTVCVTGASGFIGSWLVMRLLEKGYTVRATVLEPKNMEKVKHLLELPKAETHLTLWKADLADDGSYVEPIKGCAGVFHVATPTEFQPQDPEKEVIKPAIEGTLSIMKACVDSKTVRRLVFTSSASTVNVEEHQKSEYDENCWSDTEFILSKKMTAWVYFLSKTLTEKAAWKFAEENKLDFVAIVPPLVVGSFIIPSMPSSLHTALSILTGNEAHYSIMKQCQYIHLDDLCNAHIFLFEHPEAKGRYICSSHDATIYDIVKLLQQKYSDHYNIPSKFKGIEEDLKIVHFSSKKLQNMGFQFKYSLEDMFVEAIETCQSKGLLANSLFHNQN